MLGHGRRDVTARHPLLSPDIVRAIEQAASQHLGRPWVSLRFTDLNDQASHPAGIHHGRPFSVFAKLSFAAGSRQHFAAELSGFDLIRQRTSVATPTPVATGLAGVDGGTVLLLEALPERPAQARTAADYRAIGRTIASLHQASDDRFGLAEFDGFFGPLYQDNEPVPSNRWADFYGERRVLPLLRAAVDSQNLPSDLATAVQNLVPKLSGLCGPEPRPALLHGDAQQNNFLSTPSGAVVIDVCPYFGHPEVDLALVDIFAPAPGEVLAGYREISPVDPGFGSRRELWRVHAYLAVIAVDGRGPFGRQFIPRLADALARYR